MILLIDDDISVLRSLTHQLKHTLGNKFNYDVAQTFDEAEDVINAVLASGASLALIISDWIVPPDKGTDFLIRMRKKVPDTALILLSGFAKADSVDRLFDEAHLNAHISKPWREDELVNRLKENLSSYLN